MVKSNVPAEAWEYRLHITQPDVPVPFKLMTKWVTPLAAPGMPYASRDRILDYVNDAIAKATVLSCDSEGGERYIIMRDKVSRIKVEARIRDNGTA